MLYDEIGIDYNRTRKADPYIANKILELLKSSKDKLYLDVGCGTGNYTVDFSEKGLDFYGIDPSQKMLKEAAKNVTPVTWLEGSVESLPIKDNFFDGVVAMLTIHHWQDLYQGFAELHRVLKQKGRMVIFTSLPKQMKNYWLGHYFPQMVEKSILQMPSLEILFEIFDNVGFDMIDMEIYDVQNDLQDLFLYAGKNQPEIYLDNNIRNGISSFSSLADGSEVKKGITSLKQDISTGNFNLVNACYNDYLGDYVFLVAERK